MLEGKIEGRKRLDRHCRPILGVLSVSNKQDDICFMHTERNPRGKTT